MATAKLSDAQPINEPQSGKAKLSDAKEVDERITGHDTVSAPLPIGSIPWMKEKAYQTVTGVANAFPTIGGVVGGLVGGGVGEGINPVGGGVPGAIIGAGVGGSAGDAVRQGILHAEGYDKYDDPKTKTAGHRLLSAVEEGAGQAAGEASGHLLGKWMRPTLDRSLAKLYYAGGIKYGNPLGPGDLETVMDDLIKTEKSTGKATTVGDFLGVINQAKKDIGNEVDLKMALPVKENGKLVMLGKAHADSTPIVNAINSLLTADPSIVKEAAMNKAGKEAQYLETVKKEALKFQKQPWTYEELTSKRIRLNNELAPLYTLPPGEQRVYLLDHPDLAIKKAQADAIRDIIYPKMDVLSGQPMGTTAELQGKRGALMSLENQVNDHLGGLKTKARQARGAPPMEKVNISSYGTTGGKPGLAVHRLTGLVHTPNPERAADTQVKKAFGHGLGPTSRKVLTSPYISDKILSKLPNKAASALTNTFGGARAGDEILSVPLRLLVNPAPPLKRGPTEPALNGTGATSPNVEDGTPQSSVVRPKDLIEKAKQINNPAAQGQVAYNHTAVNPKTNHVIGSHDGVRWFDFNTGEKVA